MNEPTSPDGREATNSAGGVHNHPARRRSRSGQRWAAVVVTAVLVLAAWRLAMRSRPEALPELDGCQIVGSHDGELYVLSQDSRVWPGTLVVEAWSPRTRHMRTIDRIALMSGANGGAYGSAWTTERGVCELILPDPNEARTPGRPRSRWIRCVPYGGGAPSRLIDGLEVGSEPCIARYPRQALTRPPSWTAGATTA